MAEQSGDKSQEATPHRRQKAREQGQVPTSQDLNSAALLLVGILTLMLLGRAVMEHSADSMKHLIGGDAWLTMDAGGFVQLWRLLLTELAKVMLPVLGAMLLAAVLINLFQVGFLLVPQRVAPDLTRISPLKGLQRLFSLTAAMRLTFGLFKVLVISGVALASLYDRWDAILETAAMEAPQIAVFILDITLWTCLKIGVALLIIALLDYAYQRWKHEQDLRMTTQEVREEMKDLQGDPQIIARRRAVQRQLVLNRLADLVPKADVVVTNPTELAVAIQYDYDTMAAPIVLAKGAGVIAQRIRRLALEHDIPIVEKKPLARALYKEVEMNHPIPDKLYAAVAEVLAYVYRLKGKPMPDQEEAA